MQKLLLATTLLLICIGCNQPRQKNRYHDITQYGAVPNDDKLDTEAIQKAIDNCTESGGGTVYFPPGQFNSGSLVLKKKVSLNFASGSKLQASQSLSDYAGEKHSFITGENLADQSISGKGIIDGAGHVFWDDNFKALERPEPWIRLTNCQNVTIEGIRFQNSPSHTIRLENSEEVTINNISIVNPFKGPNTDGIDIVDSKNVMISNSFISTGDDAICLKSQKDTVENVVVTNCILESDDAAIKFGTGSKVATRFCSFSNNVIRKTRYGISLFMLDGGIFEHNNFSDLIIENDSRHKYQYPIFIDIDKKKPERGYGKVRNNSFSNIKIVTDGKVLISGHPESHIENITFNNISMRVEDTADFSKSKKPRGNKNYPKLATSTDLSQKPVHFVFGYTDGLTLKDIQVSGDDQYDLLYLEEVSKLDKTNFKRLK